MKKTIIHKVGDVVKYDGVECVVIRVFDAIKDHVYYDLETKEESVLGTGYKRKYLSIYYDKIEGVQQ